MAYTKQQWIDNQTPLDASHMNHIENGIELVSNDLANVETTIDELNASTIDYSNTTSGLQATNIQGAIDELGGTVTNRGVYENTDKAITNSAWNEILTINTQGAGIYLVTYGAMFATNSNGRRSIRLVFGGSPNNFTMHTVKATEAETSLLGLSWVIKTATPVEVSLQVWQNSGANLNVKNRCIYLTKLK